MIVVWGLDGYSMKNPQEAKMLAVALHAIQPQPTNSALWDGVVALGKGIVDIPMEAWNALENYNERAFVNAEEYQQNREYEAIVRRAFESKQSDHSWLGDAVVGFFSTIPYMAYAALPYGTGFAVVALAAANDFEKQVVDAGGDVTDPEFFYSKFAVGAAYAAIEKVQVIKPALGLKNKGLAMAYANMYKNIRNFSKVAMNSAGKLTAEVWEEGLQEALTRGFVASGLDKDLAAEAARGLAEGMHASIGPFMPIVAIEGGLRHYNYRRGGMTTEDVANAVSRMKGIIEEQEGKMLDATKVRQWGKEYGTMAMTWANAGGSLANRVAALEKTFGLSRENAVKADAALGEMYKAVKGDANARSDFFAGGKMHSAIELASKILGNAEIIDNEDGTQTLRGTLGADANGKTVSFTFRRGRFSVDPESKAQAPSIISALTKAELIPDGTTLDDWFEKYTPAQRAALVEQGKLHTDGNFLLTAISEDLAGSEEIAIDENIIKAIARAKETKGSDLEGIITIDEDALPQTAFHEAMHGFLKVVEKLSPDLHKALKEAYPAVAANETLNEERLADNMRDYLTGKIKAVEFDKDLLDRIIDTAKSWLGIIDSMKAEELRIKNAKTAQEHLFNQLLTGDFTGIPELDKMEDVKAARERKAEKEQRQRETENNEKKAKEEATPAEQADNKFGGKISDLSDKRIESTAGNIKSDGMLLNSNRSETQGTYTELISDDPDATLSNEKNLDFVWEVVRALNDASLLTADESNISVDGWKRIRNAVLGAIVTSHPHADSIIKTLAEDNTLNIDNILNAIRDEAHHLLKVKASAGKEVYDITPDIADALKDYIDFKHSGVSDIDAFLAQQDMFANRPSLTESIMREFFAKKASQQQIADTLREYAKLAMLQDNDTPTLFETAVAPRERLWELAVNKATGERYSIEAKASSIPSAEEVAEARRQYDEVVARYTNPDGTKKPGWMKAPNGKPTKLTEEQWVWVRTPNFKKWFGDWEGARLLDLAEKAWDDKNFKGKFAFVPSDTLTQRLAELLGHPVQEIVITADAVRHMKSHHGDAVAEARRGQIGMTAEDALLLPYILNNFDDAVRVPNQDRPHGEKAVEIRKQINGVAIVATIEQGKDKQFVVSLWRKVSAASMQSGNTASPRPNVLNDTDKHRIAKEIAEIKGAARNSSRVVDENGEPLVVHHATDDSFTEFKREKLGAFTEANSGNVDLAKVGFWFNNNDLSKKLFTENSIPVFLNIKNPSPTTFEDMYDGFRDEAADGYIVDDSELGGTSYVALESNQIKSATDNIGTYSQRNDIRYSIRVNDDLVDLDKFNAFKSAMAIEQPMPEGVNLLPEGVSPFEALRYFEENILGKTIRMPDGETLTLDIGHFFRLVCDGSHGKKGYVEGFDSSKSALAAIRKNEVLPEKINGYQSDRARMLPVFLDTVEHPVIEMQEKNEPSKTQFVKRYDVDGGRGVVAAFRYIKDGKKIQSFHGFSTRYGKVKKYRITYVDDAAIRGASPDAPELTNQQAMYNVPQPSADVKRYSINAEVDRAYLDAVRRGDMETAQRMVREAAERAGYTIKSYHGTLATNFTEFKKSFIGSRFSFDDKGFFFIDRKNIAEDYARSEFDSNRKGRVLDVYLKVKKPLIVNAQYALKEGLGEIFKDNDVIDVWDNYSAFLLEEAETKRVDGIIIDDGATKMTVVFDSSQIKSSDPVTYDDAGNVIPLSERFNSQKDDIRWSISGIYTGSAADYEKPSLHYIGTGEGSQVYGWGLYGSNVRGVAEQYAKNAWLNWNVDRKKTRNGRPIDADLTAKSEREKNDVYIDYIADSFAWQALYNARGDIAKAVKWVDYLVYDNRPDIRAERADELHRKTFDRAIDRVKNHAEEFNWKEFLPHKYLYEQTFFTNRAPGDESHLLMWYGNVSDPRNNFAEQKKWIRAQAKKEGVKLPRDLGGWGEDIYNTLANVLGSPKAASEFLARAGIDGVKYPVDSYGKTVKDGDEVGWNYVSFRDDNIRVDHKWVDGAQRWSVGSDSPHGVQKQAGVAYPDAGQEISGIRFSMGVKAQEEAKSLIIRKRPDLRAEIIDEAIKEISKFEKSKEWKAALHWFIKGAIRLPEDASKVSEAIMYAERAKGKANTDALSYASPMQMIEALHEFKPKSKPTDPDTVPELSDKRDEGNGIVSYEVADTREGQAAMRKIIDTHWGEDANPWCLLARSKLAETREQTEEYKRWLSRHWDLEGDLDSTSDRYERETGQKAYRFVHLSDEQRMSTAWDYWNHYSALPKRVAFKNGRLLAFMATNDGGDVVDLEDRLNELRNTMYRRMEDYDDTGAYSRIEDAKERIANLVSSQRAVDAKRLDTYAYDDSTIREVAEEYGSEEEKEAVKRIDAYDNYDDVTDADYSLLQSLIPKAIQGETNKIEHEEDEWREWVDFEAIVPSYDSSANTANIIDWNGEAIDFDEDNNPRRYRRRADGSYVSGGEEWWDRQDESHPSLDFARGDGYRYSIITTNEGKKIVLLDRVDEISKIDLSNWRSLREYLISKIGKFLLEDMVVANDLPDEYIFSDDAKGNNKRTRKAKAKLATSLDEAAEAASDRIEEDAVHKQRENGKYYRRNFAFIVPLGFTGAYRFYSADIVSYMKNGIEQMYDVVNIKDAPDISADLPQLAARMTKTGISRILAEKEASINKVSQSAPTVNGANVNSRFSIEANLANARLKSQQILDAVKGTVLGDAINKDFKETSTANLIGQTITSPEDLAALAQIYRNPSFETFRYFFVKNGEVVWQTGVTARLPSNAPVTVPASGRFVDSDTMQEIMRMHDVLQPDTVYLLHNHPSGNVAASAPDIKATQVLAQFFVNEGINFGGHIIIDHNVFGMVDAFGNFIERPMSLGSVATYENSRMWHPQLLTAINSPADLAKFAADLQRLCEAPNGNVFTLIGANAKGKVVSIANIPTESFAGDAVEGVLKAFQLETGAVDLLIAGDLPINAYAPEIANTLKTAFIGNVIKDFVSIFDTDGLRFETLLDAGLTRQPKANMPNAERVEDGSERYEIEGEASPAEVMGMLEAMQDEGSQTLPTLADVPHPRYQIEAWGNPYSYSKRSLVQAMATADLINGNLQAPERYRELAEKLGVRTKDDIDYVAEAKASFDELKDKVRALQDKGLTAAQVATETAKLIDRKRFGDIASRIMSQSAKYGVDVGGAAMTAWQKIMKRLVAEAKGLDLAEMQMDTGADLLKTIIDIMPEEFGGESEKASADYDENGENENGYAEGEFVGPPDLQTWEEWQANEADRLSRYNRVIALVKASIEEKQKAIRAREWWS